MQISGENWTVLPNDTVIGPLRDGQLLVSYCEAIKGRPRPNVKWYADGKALAGEFILLFQFLFYFNCSSVHVHLLSSIVFVIPYFFFVVVRISVYTFGFFEIRAFKL